MAITRAQQAKQMLQNGGRIGLRRGGVNEADVEAGLATQSMSDFSPSEGGTGTGAVDTGGLRSESENVAATLNVLNNLNKGDNESFLSKLPTPINVVRKFLDKSFTDFRNKSNLRSRTNFLNKIGYGGQFTPEFIESDLGLQTLRNLGYTTTQDRLDNREDDDDDSPILFPRLGIMAQAPSDMDQEPEIKIDDTDDVDGRFRRFRADGGPIGGEYDFESARQMYGLGKLVKKVTRTVKKIAKSPIGKAAIAYGLTGGLSNLAAGKSFGANFFSPSSFITKGGLRNIFTKQGLGNIASSFGLGSMISEKTAGDAVVRKFAPNLLGKILTSPAGLIAGTSIAAGLLTPAQEEEAQLLADNTNIDIEAARNAILARARAKTRDDYKMDFRARGFRAEGGPAEGKEPVAKKTMPLLDMDGKEMDLRDEGGFVPIGRMEKADDVPARLSKNEFVFTADAVRNAGDGNVDKGAEVMYNMMKNLEAGGDVSEESQGLEGARKMFQTSQRLEEVL